MKKTIFIIVAIVLLINANAFAQTKSDVLKKATADSTHFVINAKGGWAQYGACVTKMKSDSITFEVILQHSKTDIDWTKDQYIGRIKSKALQPQNALNLSYDFFMNIYLLRIESNGKCYLRLSSGVLVDSDPVILPIKVIYKP